MNSQILRNRNAVIYGAAVHWAVLSEEQGRLVKDPNARIPIFLGHLLTI
jgi:hypothetical protein